MCGVQSLVSSASSRDTTIVFTNLNSVDEIELECKIDEYRRVREQAIDHRRILLTQVREYFTKVDNSQFQNTLMLKRIDDYILKV